MPTGIRFPIQLPVASRNAHSDTFENSRSNLNMEVGPSRRRNLMRKPARLFSLQWQLSQSEFQIFDLWWQDSIKGGSLQFDLQLLDDDQTLVWYTMTARGEYAAEVADSLIWIVSLQVRALNDHFGVIRAPGTDELRSQVAIGVTTSGALLIPTVLRGRASIGIAAMARLNLPPLRGTATVGLPRLPRGRLA